MPRKLRSDEYVDDNGHIRRDTFHTIDYGSYEFNITPKGIIIVGILSVFGKYSSKLLNFASPFFTNYPNLKPIIFILVVMMIVYVAILNDKYEKVKEEKKDEELLNFSI